MFVEEVTEQASFSLGCLTLYFTQSLNPFKFFLLTQLAFALSRCLGMKSNFNRKLVTALDTSKPVIIGVTGADCHSLSLAGFLKHQFTTTSVKRWVRIQV